MRASLSTLDDSQSVRKRHWLYVLFISVSLLACWPSVEALIRAGLKLDVCSQVLFAPFITAILLYWRRASIFRAAGRTRAAGGILVLLSAVAYLFVRLHAAAFGSYEALSALALTIILIWICGFYAVYGATSLRAGAFPLGFLMFMIPIPEFLLNPAISYLQWGSTAVANRIFEALGVPVLRRGFILSVPGLTIEVAKECSSIHSSLALVITCLVAGYLYLRSPLKRSLLVLLAVPLSVVKNGVRIVTLSLLSIYVNPAFMTGDLHRNGGVVFYLLAIAILFPIFRWLEILERRTELRRPQLPGDRLGLPEIGG